MYIDCAALSYVCRTKRGRVYVSVCPFVGHTRELSI